jgi:O-antigen ligase
VLRFLLFFNLLFVVYQSKLNVETHLPGVAPTNLIFVLILLTLRGKEEQLATPEKPFLTKALIVFGSALTLASLWGIVRGTTDLLDDLTYLKNALFFPLFYFLYLRCKQDEKGTRQLIIWILVIVAVGGLQAIRQGFDYGFGKYNPMKRASGPFGADWHMSNRAGVFFSMFYPMFFSIVLFLRGQKLWRIAAVAGCALIAGGALFTYSRQSYFLILLAMVILLVWRSVIAAVIMGAIMVASIGLLPDSVTQRVEETKEVSKTGEEEVDASTSSRWEIWEGGMGMLKDNPLGVGLHRFPVYIGTYAPAHKGFDAHNFYVLTLCEAGPQGLLTLIFLWFTIFRFASMLRRRTPPEDPELRALTVGFTVASVIGVLGAIYGSPTLEGSVMGPYWALAGLLERYVQLKNQRLARGAGDTAPEADDPERRMLQRFPLSAHILPGRKKD